MKYYIYTATVEGVLKYIGKGCGERYKHLTSGTSHVYEANEIHFLAPHTINVEVVEYFDTEQEALAKEKAMIQGVYAKDIHQLWNKIYNNKAHTNKAKVIDDAKDYMSELTKEQKLDDTVIQEILAKYELSMDQYLEVAGLKGDYKMNKAMLEGYVADGKLTFKVKGHGPTPTLTEEEEVELLKDVFTRHRCPITNKKLEPMAALKKEHNITGTRFDKYKYRHKATMIALGFGKFYK